ncbi:MAG: DNA-processing protein DprA, partial [Oscillospiraceae bacterium]|nr:DNA-processing protein DprA [Oscillospiraceae bacterium]
VGIDSCAHRSAVNNSGYTVAVLGCGITVNYPSENEELKNAILQSGGALVSELLPYASVTQGYFKRRNRIIAGISCATLIAEASSRSGALLTAEHALNQKRALLCIPPQDIFAERFYGLAKLMREGAKPVCDICDIYTALISSDDRASKLNKLLAQKEKQWQSALMHSKPVVIKSSVASAKSTDKPVKPKPIEKAAPDTSQLSPEEAQIVNIVSDGAATMDEIIEKTGKKYDEICSVILGLELNDAIVRNRDGTFTLP